MELISASGTVGGVAQSHSVWLPMDARPRGCRICDEPGRRDWTPRCAGLSWDGMRTGVERNAQAELAKLGASPGVAWHKPATRAVRVAG